jgi:hypothetical protein
MSRPRSAQIDNLKTKFKRFSSIGSTVLGSNGQTYQIVKNATVGGDFDQFLSSTKSKSVGGTEEPVPAIMTFGLGSYGLVVGTPFEISMSGVNNGLPLSISITTGDIITINGGPVVTTSRLVYLINRAISLYGITDKVAVNVGGRVVVTSHDLFGVSTSSDAKITITEKLPGVLSILGFSASGSVSVVGIDSPVHGLVTNSGDGQGGVVELKTTGQIPVHIQNTGMTHTARYGQCPKFYPGKQAYARMTYVDGADVNGKGMRFDFKRVGPVPAFIISSQDSVADFTTLNNADFLVFSLAITIDSIPTGFPVLIGQGQPQSFGSITTTQQVVDTINAAFNTWSESTHNVSSAKGAVQFSLLGPYNMIGSFTVSFDSNPTVVTISTSGSLSQANFVSYINQQILTAGVSALGEAVISFDGFVSIRSKSIAGENSRVVIGNSSGSSVLSALGITPGTYTGHTFASLYGNDEIIIRHPTADSRDYIHIGGNLLTMQKFGWSGTDIVKNTTVGEQPVSIPQVQVLIPEVVEFSEEPDNYDTEIQQFDELGPDEEVDPAGGAANSLLSGLFGIDGQISSGLISKFFDQLVVQQVKLGDKSQGYVPPTDSRLEAVQHGSEPVFFWSSPTDSGTDGEIVRIYSHNGGLIITTNAKYTDLSSSVLNWARDYSAPSSVFEINKGMVSYGSYLAASISPWGHGSWNRSVQFNPTAVAQTPENGHQYDDAIVKLGESLGSSAADAAKSRVRYSIPDGGQYTLIGDFSKTSRYGVRLYAKSTPASGSDPEAPAALVITINAKYSGSNFQKDVTGYYAMAITFSGDPGPNDGFFSIWRRDSGLNSAWTDWTTSEGSQLLSLTDALTGKFSRGVETWGEGSNDSHTPRYSTSASSTHARTLVQKIQGPGSTIRLYADFDTMNGGFGNGLLLTVNAKWNDDGSSGLWTADDYTKYAFSWRFLTTEAGANKNLKASLCSHTGTGAWSDGSWVIQSYLSTVEGMNLRNPGVNIELTDAIVKFNEYGSNNNLRMNPQYDATLTNGLNVVYAKNLVKSWGVLKCSVASPAILSGFNIMPGGFTRATQVFPVVGSIGVWDLRYMSSVSTGSSGNNAFMPAVNLTVMNRSGISEAGIYGTTLTPVVEWSTSGGFQFNFMDHSNVIYTTNPVYTSFMTLCPTGIAL